MKKNHFKRTLAVCAAAILLALLSLRTASAHPGDLDLSFGEDGRVVTGFGGGPGAGRALAVQSDGKILVAGFCPSTSTNSQFAVLRLNTNGEPDSTFGGNGSVVTSIGAKNNAGANAVAVQSDGKIVAGGFADNVLNIPDFTLVRYNTDGSLDTSFGSNGVVYTESEPLTSKSVNALVIQPDNKILIAGSYADASVSGTSGFALARYNTNGTLDTSFGSAGIVETGNPNGGVFYSILLQSNGIIAAGNVTEDFVVARYLTNGALDATFGASGMTITPVGYYAGFFGGNAAIQALALQPGNPAAVEPDKIVAVGEAQVSLGITGYAVARYNLDGTFDSTFGSGGVLTGEFLPGTYNQSYAEAVFVQGTNAQPREIIIGGYATTNNNDYFAASRFTSAGALDTTFGTNGTGTLTQAFGLAGSDSAYAILQRSNKFVLAGSSYTESYAQVFSVARFSSNGVADASFGHKGVLTAGTDFPSQADGIALQKNGSIVAAGFGGGVVEPKFALARFTSSGALDTTFGTNGGAATFEFGTNGGVASAVVIQTDGKIVTAGTAFISSSNQFGLIRCNTNGLPDSSFGVAGAVLTQVGTSNAIAAALALQSDGKILVAGSSFNGAAQDFALVRYTVSGSLDGSFNSGNAVLTGMGSGASQASAIALQGDGKIILAGQAQVGSDTNFALVRYATNGSLDNTFGTFGRVTTDFGAGSSAIANATALQSDGKIVVAGGASIGGVEYMALARYNTNGAIDSTFGINGAMIQQIGTVADVARAVALDSSGGILVAGSSMQGADNDAVILRFNSSGSLDTTFASGGAVLINVSNASAVANAITLDSSGRIVVAGAFAGAFGVLRLDGEGSSVVTLSIIPSSSKHLTISWPLAATGWTLQQSTDLSGGAWVNSSAAVSNDGVNNIFTVTPTPSGNGFYRLVTQ